MSVWRRWTNGTASTVASLRAPGLAAIVVALLAQAPPQAKAQSLCANPPCFLPVGTGFANVAATSALFDRMTHFLEHQTRQMAASRWQGATLSPASRVALAYGEPAPAASRGPLDAYAMATKAPPAEAAVQRYRAWLEGYGSVSNTGPQNAFTGDRRETFGGVAGFGAAISPNVNAGLSVDQSHTDVDIQGQPQGSRMDVTQVGALVSANSGPWTLGVAGIYGAGRTRSSRFDAAGESTASYESRMWGVIVEASYSWSIENFRVVPKAGADWSHVEVDPYVETGGALPVSASAQVTERARVYGALELGYTTFAGGRAFDVSAYGKVIEIVSQNVGALTVTPAVAGFVPAVIPGTVDARFEVATGASISARLSPLVLLYANYSGRFRDGYDSHGGAVGAAFQW